MQTNIKQALIINSSGRQEGAITRQTVARLVQELTDHNPGLTTHNRDVSAGIPFINSDWIEGNFSEPENRTTRHMQALSHSETLINELKAVDAIVLGVPIYNFNIPATLKAWIDQVCRARVTFQYTENGPVGLLKNKKVYVVMASGGVPIGSPMDHASPYLKQVMGFIGLDDVTIIDANQASQNPAEALLDTPEAA